MHNIYQAFNKKLQGKKKKKHNLKKQRNRLSYDTDTGIIRQGV